MRRDGETRPDSGAGPWFGLLIGVSAAVVVAIVMLSFGPARRLHPSEVDLSAPQVLAPAAPSAMR